MTRKSYADRLNVRIIPEDKEKLDELIDDRVFASYSHAIRWILHQFLKDYKEKPFKIKWWKGV